MKNLFFTTLFFLISAISFAQDNYCNTIDYDNYALYWEDNFDYEDEERLTEKWQNIYYGDKCNNFNPYFLKVNEEGYNVIHKKDKDVRWINNGVLNLSIARLTPSEVENPFVNGDPITFNYKAGFIRSKDTDAPCETPGSWPYPTYDDDGTTICEAVNQGFSHGLFVIRAKMGGRGNGPNTGGDGFKSSLWLRTAGEEIDIVEYDPTNKEPTLFLTNYHAQQNETEACGAFVETGTDLKDDFHTYAVEWTPYKVTYYFDGEEIRTVDAHITNGCHKSYNFIASVRLLNGHLTDDQIAAIRPLQIDYVKVYHRLDETKPGKISWTSHSIDNQISKVNTDLTIDKSGAIFYGDSLHSMNILTPSLENKDSFDLSSSDNSIKNVAGDITIAASTEKVFYRGIDNKLWYFYWNGNNDEWLNSSTNSINNVDGDLVINSNRKVFYRHENQIHYTFFSGGTWWNNQADGLNNIQGELIIDSPSTKMYYVGTDNNVWVTQWADSTYWNKYRITNSGNVDTNLSVKRVDNIEHVYYAGLDKSLNVLTKIQGEYLQYSDERVNGTGYNPEDGSTSSSLVKFIDNVNGDIVISEENHIFFNGTDGNIWEVYKKPDGHIFYEQINKSPTDFENRLTSDGQNSLFYVNKLNTVSRLEYSCERLEGKGWTCNTGEDDPIRIGRANSICEEEDNTDTQFCEELNVYPNPASNFVLVKREGTAYPSSCLIRFIDIQGKLIKVVNFSREERILKVNCDNIPTGMYIIQIEFENSVTNKKIVISR